MRKRGAFAALAVLFALAGAAALVLSSLSLALPGARGEIETRLARIAGSPVQVDGSAAFSLFPHARVTLSDVRIGAPADTEAMTLEVDRVEADFDLLAALLGRTEIDRVTLIRPELTNVGAAGLPAPPSAGSPAGVAAPAAAAVDSRAVSGIMRAFLARFEGVRELRVRDGLFRLPDGRGGVSNANLSLRWPGASAAADLKGSYVWNGQPTEVDARVDAPLRFFEGTASPLRVQLVSPALDAAFVGEGAAGPSLRLAGGLRLTAPSLSRAIRWLGDSRLNLPDFGAFSIETQIQVLGDRISLGAASLDLGGNGAHGALEAVVPGGNGRPALSGTLAFDRLDFAMLTQAIAPAPRTLIDLQRPIRIDVIRRVDMDLRLSAREATLGRATASEVAATVKLADGVGTVDVGDMALFGGRGEMRIRLDARHERPALTVTAGLHGVRAADLSLLTDDALPLAAGTGSIDLTLRSPAANWGDILAGNRGELTVRIADGAMRGLDRSLLRRPGSHRLDIAASDTLQPFGSLVVKARSLGTKLRLDDVSVALDDGEAKASGVYDLRASDLEIGGEFRPTTVEASGAQDSFTTSQPIGFTLSGEWPEPVMTVGPQAKPI